MQLGEIRQGGKSTFTELNADGRYLTNLKSTSTSIFGLVISSFGTDTNIMQSTIAYINIMGDEYFNVVTTFSLAVSGIGGLDSGAEAASKWYRIDTNSRRNNSAMNIVLSDGGNTQPVLPTGYIKWRLIGRVRNDGSSNILPFHQINNEVHYWGQQILINDGSAPPTRCG